MTLNNLGNIMNRGMRKSHDPGLTSQVTTLYHIHLATGTGPRVLATGTGLQYFMYGQCEKDVYLSAEVVKVGNVRGLEIILSVFPRNSEREEKLRSDDKFESPGPFMSLTGLPR